MALPAGRYGVTKNQLLKIKKLPMNTIKLIEELTEKFNLLGTAAFKNSTSVVTESSDLVESGAVKDIVGFGNKNKYDFTKNVKDGVNTAIAFTTTGVRVYTAANAAYAVSDVLLSELNLVNGKQYVLVADVTYVSGTGKMSLRAGYTVKISSPNITASGKYVVPFEMSADLTRVSLFCTLSVAEVGDVTFNNVMICTADDYEISPTYEPYHASVEESLAEKADNSVIGTVEDGTNPTKSYAVDEFMVRDGAFCQVTAPVTTSSTWTEGSNYTKKSIAEVLQSLMS